MSKKVYVNLWLLIAGIVLFCLAIIGVGLGVYFGVRDISMVPTTTIVAQSTSSRTTPVSSLNQTTTNFTITTPTPSSVTTTQQPPNIRLPTTLFPTDYYLTIQTYLPSPSGSVNYSTEKNFTFDGNVSILIVCSESTNIITMQMHQIDIQEVVLLNAKDAEIELTNHSETYNGHTRVTKYVWDSVTQKVFFTLANNRQLRNGSIYRLNIRYIGVLNDDLAGFYRSSYEEYGILKDGWAQTNFNATPKMSSYLFAMCVADFESRSQVSHYGVNFRVWARHSFIEDSWWALIVGPEVLTYYADYFQIPFPLEKQDMVAVPDFAAGAMENWGMVTYRERDLLYNNKTYGSSNLQRTTIVITHELAHQWFGDLVTMDWWDDLWLNEGFAEFMEYKGADNVTDGKFEMKYQFIPLEIELFMGLDQLTSSHPIYDPSLQTPDEINAAFDDISYDKGASVIHQLEFAVGEDIFIKGLNYYLTSHEYANANHQDLWNGIQWAVLNDTNPPLGWDGSVLNITEFMNTWILQMGFPVITVTKINDTSVQLTQERFVLPGNFSVNPKYQTSPYNFTWYIPVRYNQNQDSYSDMYWVQPNEKTIITGITNLTSSWILLNTAVYGLYRTNYDFNNWMLLFYQLNKNMDEIDPRNRAQLLDDAMNLPKTGALPYNVSLTLTTYLQNEYNYVPWMSVTNAFIYFQNMFALTSDYKYFGKYLKKLVQPIYNQLGWNDNAPYYNVTIHELTAFIISTMCQLEDANCLANATSRFKTELYEKCPDSIMGTSNCSQVDTNFRKPVYCSGISQGNADLFNYLYNKYPEEQIAVERDNILYGLCCSKDPWALTQLLNQAINPSSTFIRSQDSQYVFQYIGQNEIGREILWKYFVYNFNAISNLFASGSFSLADIVQSVTQSFNTQQQVDEMELFLKYNYNALGSGLTAFVQQISNAQANVVWMETYSAEVIQWFKDYTLNN